VKLVQEYLYEKFTEKSDPVHDMGIGKVSFAVLYSEMVGPALDKWNKFLKSLIGKTISGNMEVFDVIRGTIRIKGKVKIVGAEPTDEVWGNVNIIDEKGNHYILDGDEDYIIE
jgi:hypothetical protein